MPLGYYGFSDPTVILVLIGAVITILASGSVRSTYNKYAAVASRTGMTGAEAAAKILRSQGIYDVTVQAVSGDLTDHYDPRTKTVNLSESVYHRTSVAALGVAAHECGHAIQDHAGYVPLRMRSAFVPVASFGNKLAWPLVVFGLIIGLTPFVQIGIWMFLLVVLFQLITLPVEFNASSRALGLLGSAGIMPDEEVRGAKKVLRAAALTYVAAAAASVLQLMRLIMLSGGRRRRG